MGIARVQALEDYWKKKGKAGAQSPTLMGRKGYRRLRQPRRTPEEQLGDVGGRRRFRRLARWLLLRRFRAALARAMGKLSDTVCAFFIGEALMQELLNPKLLSSKELRRRVAAELSTAAACI